MNALGSRMKRPRILLATADLNLKRLCGYLLEGELGAMVVHAASGADALRELDGELPVLVVLDDALRGLDGFALCHRLKAQAAYLDLPVVMLVSHLEGKYQAFRVGATDVMAKPVDQLEFLYRLKVHLKARIRRHERPGAIEAGIMRLDPAKLEAHLPPHRVALTPSEFAILAFLAARPQQVVTTESLLVEALGEPRQAGNPQVIHTHVRNLRRKLEVDPARPRFITSSRRGYSFQPPLA